ncbi:MAG: hypothetical protein PHT33_03950 [bacterium]|nr:hypothetical protein [bacterium]
MNAEERARLRELESNATPGPWAVENILWVHSRSWNSRVPLAEFGGWRPGAENAGFVAAIRNALPVLLADSEECERLREELAAARAENAEASIEGSDHIDDLLLQEIFSLREKIKIAVAAIKFHCPDFDDHEFMHRLGAVDYEQLMEELAGEPEGI